MLTFMNGTTGAFVKSVTIYNANQTPYTGHAGGVSDLLTQQENGAQILLKACKFPRSLIPVTKVTQRITQYCII